MDLDRDIPLKAPGDVQQGFRRGGGEAQAVPLFLWVLSFTLICAFLFCSESMTQVGTEKYAWVNPIRLKAAFTVPKEIEIVNKLYPMGKTHCCKPFVRGKESAERFNSLTQGWNEAWNEYMLQLALTQFLQQQAKNLFFFRISEPVLLCRMSKDPAQVTILILLGWAERITGDSSVGSLRDVSKTDF